MAALKNHILVPVDFSDQSRIALRQSFNLARLTRADLTIMHVVEHSFHLPFFRKEEDKSIEKKIQKELDKWAKETSSESGINIGTVIENGKVYEEINKTAKRLKCSFIVMGTNGSSGIKRFIGSNALRIIREAPCPVITIKGKRHRAGCKSIVLPLDMTRETKEKVSKAIEIATLFGSTIHLVSILTTDDEFIVNKLKRQMHQVYEHISDHNVGCTVEFVHDSDVGDAIISYAKKSKADLIMIMTQQERGWSDNMFIGSYAQDIINGSDIPVLSIRPKLKKDTTLSVFEY